MGISRVHQGEDSPTRYPVRDLSRFRGPQPQSHIAIWKWLQGLAPLERLFLAKRVRCFLVDETMVKVRGVEGWVWVAYEPYQRRFLGLWFSWTRSSLTAEAFLRRLVTRYGRHRVYTDGATWYPEACETLGLEHRLLDPAYKSLVKGVIALS